VLRAHERVGNGLHMHAARFARRVGVRRTAAHCTPHAALRAARCMHEQSPETARAAYAAGMLGARMHARMHRSTLHAVRCLWERTLRYATFMTSAALATSALSCKQKKRNKQNPNK
jgi:hypothetical protein